MWSNWAALSHTRSLRKLKGRAGVYRLRFRGIEFPRVRGKSELIYLGETSDRQRRLKALWYSIRQGIREPHTAGRQAKYLFYYFFGHFCFDTDIEVSYWPCGSKEEAERLQDKELTDYVVAHLEPPPLNHSTPGFSLPKRSPMGSDLIIQLFPKRNNTQPSAGTESDLS